MNVVNIADNIFQILSDFDRGAYQTGMYMNIHEI